MLKICQKYRISILAAVLHVSMHAVAWADELPGESVLPNQYVAQQAAGDQAETDLKDTLENQLPGEDQLPVRQPAIEQEQPSERAWLRVRAFAPTAPIRAVAFAKSSDRLFAAGEDKSLWSWRRLPPPFGARRPWRLDRAINWPIQRAERGTINAIAIAPEGTLVAIGGNGGFGSNGDIFLFNSTTGALENVLWDQNVGHRQTIVSIAFCASGTNRSLVSVDGAGKILFWERNEGGLWKPRVVRKSDREMLGPQTANRLTAFRGINPIVMVDQNTAISGEFESWHKSGVPLWKLVKRNLRNDSVADLKPVFGNTAWHHAQYVTAIAVSPDGNRMASTGNGGNSYLWKLNPTSTGIPFRMKRATALTLTFGSQGKQLVIGTMAADSGGSLEIYDTANPQQALTKNTPQPVRACTIRPDGKQIAYTQGDAIHIVKLDSDVSAVQSIRANFKRPGKVAFSRQPPYRIAFGEIRADGVATELTNVFDTNRVQLQTSERLNLNEWQTGSQNSGGWRIQAEPTTGVTQTLTLFENDERRGTLRVNRARQGEFVPNAICWIKRGNGTSPYAFAIGLKGTNNILVFRIVNQGVCPMIRQFRGHAGMVHSLAMSHDQRFLASTSADGTTRVWSTADLESDEYDANANLNVNRWGARFTIRDGNVVVDAINEGGPLFFRGVRRGDVILELRRITLDGQTEIIRDALPIVNHLTSAAWTDMTVFRYQRGDAQPLMFQMFPAWQAVVSLFVDDAGEWAYWSPSGFYDASFEGHKLFGWQVNGDRTELPDFFLAGQFRGTLEKPNVMAHLLRAGNITEAFRRAGANVPARPDQAIIDQYNLKPVVTILPTGPTNNKGSVDIQADISCPEGEQLTSTKAFANGVVATDRELISERKVGDRTISRYRWQAMLPSNPRVMLQVVAATEAEVVDTDEMIIQRDQIPERDDPRLFVASVGIDRYHDAQIQELNFAANNASRVAAELRDLSTSIYRSVSPVVLLNDDANRRSWDVAVDRQLARLRREASPDDLLVIFLSGHGVRDEQTGEYHYIGVDARYSDLMQGEYGDCLSFSDLARFAEIPCKKLVILDTCHAGAINDDQRLVVKDALRMLQDDMMFTLTASQGNEEAVELREKELGRFTYRLLEAVQGAADRQLGDRDGITTLEETIGYVTKYVQQDSSRDQYQQRPTAGPRELLEYTDFPLTGATDRTSKTAN